MAEVSWADVSDLCDELGEYRRTVRQSVMMLDDALHALRNNRLHITDEFVERVAASLRKLPR